MSTSQSQIGCVSGEQIRRSERRRRTGISIVELLAQLVLISMVTVTPWLFGGVQAGVQVWLFVGVMVALACWLAKYFIDRSMSTVLPVAIVPLICAMGLGVFQLVPLDTGLNDFLSPGKAQLSDIVPSEQHPSADASLTENFGIAATAERQPLSLYPASTWHDLALLVLAIAVFLLGAVFFKTQLAQIRLCGLIAVNGAALAFWGLVQQLTNGQLYWRMSPTGDGGPFGLFVNKNNAAGFLLLCLAGAVGMTVWVVTRQGTSSSGTSKDQLREKDRLSAKPRQRWLEFLAHLNALTIVSLSLVVIIVTGILCSLSRGAWIAMIGATILTTLIVYCARRRTARLWWIGVAAMTGLALVGWLGMSDSVHARFATLFDQETISQARIPHWGDGLKAAADFWPLGSGLGTYRYVYGPYQQRLDEAWYYHAENQYLEALVEGGIVGLGLMLLMIGLVGMSAWRLLRDDPGARTFAFGVAGIFALTGQAIHAFFDFALYIPANMVLFALLCGSISGRAAHLAQNGLSPRFFALPRTRSLAMLLAASLLVAGFWGCLEIRQVATVEGALKNTRFVQTPSGATPEALQAAIKQLSVALEQREDDAEAHHRMAELWVHLYRIRAYEQLRREAAPGADDRSLWQLTSPIVLHGRAHQFVHNNRMPELERLRSEPVVRNHLAHALRHLILARRCCALLPRLHLTTAALSVLAVDPSDDRIHLERVRQLAPSDPHLLFQCGVLEMNAGRAERAYESWRGCLALGSRYRSDILRFVGRQLAHPQTIEKLLPDSPALLIQLGRERYGDDEHDNIRHMLAQRAEDLIEQGNYPEDERRYLHGSVCALKKLYPQAIENYSRAVKLRLHEAGWRYELALALKQEGMLGKAHEQARLCARMEPDNRKYRTLLEEINHTRLTPSVSSE